MRFLRLIFIYRFGLFIALLPGVRPGFDASCLKILFGFPRYSDCRWRFIDRRRSLHRGIRAAALALPCVSCRIIAARGRRSNRPHIGSAGICGCRCRSCRMELPDHRLRSALRKSWPNSPCRRCAHWCAAATTSSGSSQPPTNRRDADRSCTKAT